MIYSRLSLLYRYTQETITAQCQSSCALNCSLSKWPLEAVSKKTHNYGSWPPTNKLLKGRISWICRFWFVYTTFKVAQHQKCTPCVWQSCCKSFTTLVKTYTANSNVVSDWQLWDCCGSRGGFCVGQKRTLSSNSALQTSSFSKLVNWD